jgi:NitT/TauT family transport system substrate-binding protein
MTFKRISAFIVLALVLMLVASCDSGTTAPTPTAESGVPATSTTDVSSVPQGDATNTPAASNPTATIDLAHPTKVTIALGYNPDVQFAPFYLALNKGYYKDEGLDVTFKHGIVPDLIKLLGNGDEGVNYAVASGDEIIPARLQGIPVVYVMTWYQQYPVAAVSKKGKGPDLKSPADLKGHTVGIPGPYGSTYTGLLALLKAGGLTLNDIQVKNIGFTQIENLTTDQVDVAMVYAANEPVQLRSQGYEVNTLLVSDYMMLASNGLVANLDSFKDAQLTASVIRATQRGIQETIKDPDAAFQEAMKEVPDIGGTNKDKQLSVLKETIKLMEPKPDSPAAQSPTGWTDVQVWADTQDFLFDSKIIDKKGKVQEMFSNRFVVGSQD